VWSPDSDTPTTVRGHSNTVTKVINCADKWLVSADQDGRLLCWNTETHEASRPSGVYKHPIQVVALAANQKYIYSGSGD
jgi:WD40 repeat protein